MLFNGAGGKVYKHEGGGWELKPLIIFTPPIWKTESDQLGLIPPQTDLGSVLERHESKQVRCFKNHLPDVWL